MEDNAIWNCEGVQVGGLGSLFGILGSWTTLSHDIDDPVGEKSQTLSSTTPADKQSLFDIGPFWLCKITDDADFFN